MKEVQKLMDDVREWGDATFGDRQSAYGILSHMLKEVAELRTAVSFDYKYEIEEELADCFMLFLEASSHCGVSVEKLVELTYAKLEINKKRKWGKPNTDGSIQHIEE